MSDWTLWVPRFIHIFFGVVWIGGAMLWTMIIAPNVLQRGPPPIRRPFLEAALAPFTKLMIVSGLVTILAGFWLLAAMFGISGMFDALRIPGYGIAMGIGILAAIAMYVEGFTIIRPTGHKLLTTLQGIPPPAPGAPPGPPPQHVQDQLAAMGNKLKVAGITNIVLGAIAIGAMVWAVNIVR